MSSLFDIDKNGVLLHAVGNDLISFVPEGVKSIASEAYCDYNPCLCEIYLPDSVLEIQKSAFADLYNLHSITLSRNIRKIGDNAFSNCENLISLELPDSLESIGVCALENTKRLNSISCNAPHVDYASNLWGMITSCPQRFIDEHGFVIINDTLIRYCGNSMEVVIPSGVKYINPNAFSGNIRLFRVVIPDSVEIVGSEAFLDCVNLESVIVPAGVKIVGSAFAGCKSLIDKSGLIWINDELVGFGGKSVGTLVIPEGVKRIPDYFAFDTNSKKSRHKIRNIILPDSVEEIGENAFANNTFLETVTLGNGIKRISRRAFYLCDNLYKIEIPVDVEIEDEALAGCTSLSKNGFLIYGDRIACYGGRDAHVVIPDTIRHIDSYAFKNSGVISVNLNNVETIGDYAFDRCFHLIDVDLGNSLRTIGEYAFQGTHVNRLEFPDTLLSIGANAFRCCSALDNVLLPDSISELKEGTFSFCEDLQSINLSNITSLGRFALDMDFVSKCVEKSGDSCTETLMSYAGYYSWDGAEELNFSESDNDYLAYVLNRNNTNSTESPGRKRTMNISQLEKIVAKGSFSEIKSFALINPDINFAARALLIAANQRGVDIFRMLIESGYSFDYNLTPAIQRRLKDSNGSHGVMEDSKTCCPFYLGLIPSVITDSLPAPLVQLKELKHFEVSNSRRTTVEERLKIISLIAQNPIRYGVIKDDLLMYAFMCNELDLANKLIEMGFSLNEMPPVYALYEKNCGTYVDILRSGKANRYRLNFIHAISKLDSQNRILVLTAMVNYLKRFRCKLTFNYEDFTSFYDDVETFEFILENCRFVSVNKKYALTRAINNNEIRRIRKYLASGWIASAEECIELTDYCANQNKMEALALLTQYYIDRFTQGDETDFENAFVNTIHSDAADYIKSIWGYKVLPDGTIRINSYKGSLTEVRVPSEIDGRLVTVIGSNAFGVYDHREKNAAKRKKIKSIVLPESINIIESYAFMGSEKLTCITLPESIEHIGEYAFSKCNSLQRIELPQGLKVIANGLFLGDGNLCEVLIPDGVISIGMKSFTDCISLKSLNLPDSIVDVGPYAFYGCSSISELRFGINLRMLDNTAFWSMASGTDIFLGPEVVVVGKRSSRIAEISYPILHKDDSVIIHTIRNSTTARNVLAMKRIMTLYDY